MLAWILLAIVNAIVVGEQICSLLEQDGKYPNLFTKYDILNMFGKILYTIILLGAVPGILIFSVLWLSIKCILYTWITLKRLCLKPEYIDQ